MFKLKADFKPTADQPQAIEKLVHGVKNGLKNQVLLGVTGSGKTFTMANVIDELQMPALVISHNKTLAGQLFQEMRQFFPENAVSYFVSYYDYYQPEAYMPQTDTYIEKEAQINDLIDKLRLQATTNILTRNDVIVVASVSCIYNIGSPIEYGNFILKLTEGSDFILDEIARRLAELQYERSEFDFKRGTFRVRNNYLDIYPAYEDFGYRVYHNNNISKIVRFNPLTGIEIKSKIQNPKSKTNPKSKIENLIIYPAKHYMTDSRVFKQAEPQIRNDLQKEAAFFKKEKMIVEAERLTRRVNYDLEMIKEVGYVNGIENYSRYFDGRAPGDAPYTLLDYFKQTYGNDFLVFIDESHMTIPQIQGMFNGDYSRKKILTSFGFRLKAAFDNRPLKFDEFYKIPPYIIYSSATPSEWEIKISNIKSQILNKQNNNNIRKIYKQTSAVSEQLIRPTGIPDPKIKIRQAKNEIKDLMVEIVKQVKLKRKVLVTTLTKRIAEDLTNFLKEKKIRTEYLHSDIETLERSNILDNLRKNKYDVLVGINLLREGLDLPEVALVAILDADKEGFLRSKTALIQTMGRAARNVDGLVIIYADILTKSIRASVNEIERRRKYQLEYNKKHKINPKTIYKPIREKIIEQAEDQLIYEHRSTVYNQEILSNIKTESLTPYDKNKLIKRLEREMKRQATELNFELAIKIRDKVKELKN